METSIKNSIKSKIREAINSNDAKEYVLRVGITGTELRFASKKAFGERVLSQLEREDVKDIAFKGLDNNAIKFQVFYLPKKTIGNDMGYGRGRYMAD